MSSILLKPRTPVKYVSTCLVAYPSAMDNRSPEPHYLSRNLRFLLKQNELSEAALAKRAGLSQKAINNILNQVNSPTVETLNRIAGAFGLESWYLLIPGLPDELLQNPTLGRLISVYIKTPAPGRNYIDQVAERESEYAKTE